MAFNQPLEADRVDDINLLSTLARAPVIGALLWVLGGDKAREEEEEQRKQQALDDETRNNIMDQSSTALRSNLKRSPSSLNSTGLKKGTPSLLGSEVSDVGESMSQGMDLIRSSSSRSSLYEKCMPKKKALSWSDQCGKDLNYYDDESSPKEPLHPKTEPKKSAMSRTRSVTGRMGNNENRFLPNSLVKKRENSAAIRPYNSTDSAEGGIESPQWGWYIRTTPPTPEMYHSRPLSKHLQSQGSAASTATASSVGSGALHPPAFAHTNPVFQNLQENNKKQTPAGWPSVPL